MTESVNQAAHYVTVNSATQSDHLTLDNSSNWYLEFTSGGAFALDLQQAVTTFSDVFMPDLATKLTINSASGPQGVVVAGGLKYRMDVDVYNSPITMTARRVSGL